MSVSGPTSILAEFDQCLLEGEEVSPESFIASGRAPPELHDSLRALVRLRSELGAALAFQPDPPLEVPPGYRLQAQLGRGGHGTVWAARQEATGAQVALKAVPIASAVHRERLRREAVLLGRLSHPNIARVLDYQEHGAYAFLVTERVLGAPLSEVLRVVDRIDFSSPTLWSIQALEQLTSDAHSERGFPASVLTPLAEQLYGALEHGHARGVVHRDIKPANLLITPEGNLKVIDYGIGRDLNANASGGTQTGAFIGTWAYAAPEQLLGESGEIGPAVDLFAASVTLFEAATQRLPFAATDYGERVQSVEAPPLSLKRLRPDLPSALTTRIQVGLAPDPSTRHGAAATTPSAFAKPTTRRRWAVAVLLCIAGALAVWRMASLSRENASLRAQLNEAYLRAVEESVAEERDALQRCLEHAVGRPRQPGTLSIGATVEGRSLREVSFLGFPLAGREKDCLTDVLEGIEVPTPPSTFQRRVQLEFGVGGSR